MRIRNQFLFSLAGCLMTMSAVSVAQERNVALLASSCAACHGTNGHSVGGIPSLAGSSESHIIEQMRQFTEGDRVSTVMLHHASGYTQEEIELMAAYFAKQ
ncbi:MAG: cytochrome C [Methylophaga sp.]|nr:MAG: cytochrome C [Methylophaga sp.]